MKILFVTSTLTSGGSERVMSILANEFCHRGYDVSIVCFNKRICFYTLDKRIQVYYAEVESTSTNLFIKIKWFRSFVRRIKPDVIIPFMVAVYSITIISILGLHIPIVASERIDPKHSSSIKKLLRILLLPLVDYLVVQTESMKSYFPEFIRRKSSVIHNPVSEKVYEVNGISKENRIVNIGKLHHQKNQRMLIEAFSEITNEFPQYKLYIYGEGPLRLQLENRIKALGLEEKVFMPGAVNNVIEEISKAKLFCLSSNYEGLSNAVIEAICVGLPVVSTSVSGTSDLVENGINGEVVEVGNVKGLAEAMRRVLCDNNKMKRYCEANKSKADYFRTGVITDQWEKVIKSIVNHEFTTKT